ncbi:uncharacterized protein LOC135959887 [Calliphora vicina]|uniref:uncharacterized protein LOC135959887 n=1 Tax=Calliphora vicina TaxID=7373 RepID=UPI00325AFE9B
MANIKSLPLELQIVAENELAEKPNRIPSDLQALRTWIEQQPHLNARLEEQFLIQYLRGCKYSLEKAKVKIDLFFTLKSKFPDFFNVTDIHEARFRKMWSYSLGIPLPRPLNDHGPRICFMKFEEDVAKGLVDFDDLYRVTNAMHEILIMDDPYAGINGIIYVIDLKNITINMASKYTPTFLRKLVQFYEKSLPLRIKGAHLINTPVFFHSVMSIVLPLLSEKLRERISVNGQNYDSLYKIIPKQYFPSHLGGENGTIAQLFKDFEQKWLEYEKYFKENANYGTNELLRPGKPLDFDSMFGLGGSFRKLDVDCKVDTMTNIRPLTKELQQIACEELNEVPERVPQDLKDFKEWLAKQTHLKARTDEQFLISFLRGCKFSMEKAKLKIDRYYTLKTKYPDFYTIQNVKDPRVKELVDLGRVGITLPHPLNVTGPRILYVRTGLYPTETFSFADVMCIANALQEICMWEDDYCVICGYVQILDMTDYSAAHMLQMTPTVVKKMSTFAEDAVPLRQRAIHIINMPVGFEKVFNMLKPLLPLKQQERMFAHGSNLASLYEHIPQKYLPQELGGENGSLDELTQEITRNFAKHHEYFMEDLKYRVDEQLRVNKIINYDNVFGTQGTFRKLNVD